MISHCVFVDTLPIATAIDVYLYQYTCVWSIYTLVFNTNTLAARCMVKSGHLCDNEKCLAGLE